jgi:hypothetical protein
MSPEHAVRLARLVLLALLAGTYLWLAAGRPPTRWVRLLAVGLLVAAALSYPNFGLLHPQRGSPPAPAHIHYWDAFHYFMGAKYLPELGYSRLYEATLVAGRELGAFDYVAHLRDLTTYALREPGSVDAAAVRARFSPARWEAFKRDLLYFGPQINEWRGLLQDHGYNDPPPRALLLHCLVRGLPANLLTVTLLTSIDYLAMLAAFGFTWWGFGQVPAMLAFAFLWLSPLARFDFIGGSVLRWDWFAALVIAAAALARGWGGAAGVLLGYATLARIFPAIFLAPLAVKWVQGRRGRLGVAPERVTGRCLAAALAVLLVAGAGLVAVGDEGAWLSEYRAKIRLHGEGAFVNAVGLGSLIAAYSAPWIQGADGRIFVSHAALIAARPAPWVLGLAATLYAALALPLVLRARALESLMVAVPFVYIALSPTGYYYGFLVLLVLLPWRDGRAEPVSLVEMSLLAAVMAASYGFEAASAELLTFFSAVSLQLALYFLLWVGFEYARLFRGGARRPSADIPAHDTVGSETRLPRL